MYKTAVVTQSTIDWIDKQWKIVSGKWVQLKVFPDSLTHLPVKGAMDILHIAREVETISYREWLKDQMVKSKLDFDKQSLHLKNEIARLTIANESLTNKLAQYLFDNEI